MGREFITEHNLVGGIIRQESNGDFLGNDYYSCYEINESQHPQMATHYRGVIADVLQELQFCHSRQF